MPLPVRNTRARSTSHSASSPQDGFALPEPGDGLRVAAAEAQVDALRHRREIFSRVAAQGQTGLRARGTGARRTASASRPARDASVLVPHRSAVVVVRVLGMFRTSYS